MSESDPPIEMVRLHDVSLRLGGARVLAGVDLTVRRGETVVLLGRSGSGKSTTLRLINGLVSPETGSVFVRGRPIADWDPITLRRGIGYILQEVGLFPHFSVARNVGLVPGLLGWARPEVEARVREMLELVGLTTDIAARRPAELSGGQRQRVGIARALAARPDLVLCDEPFGALDPVTRFDLQREFRTLCERLGTTLVFVTHDVREARRLADRIAFLRDGALGFVGTVEEFDEAEDPALARFRQAGVA